MRRRRANDIIRPAIQCVVKQGVCRLVSEIVRRLHLGHRNLVVVGGDKHISRDRLFLFYAAQQRIFDVVHRKNTLKLGNRRVAVHNIADGRCACRDNIKRETYGENRNKKPDKSGRGPYPENDSSPERIFRSYRLGVLIDPVDNV